MVFELQDNQELCWVCTVVGLQALHKHKYLSLFWFLGLPQLLSSYGLPRYTALASKPVLPENNFGSDAMYDKRTILSHLCLDTVGARPRVFALY
jgi:hypothetical protein